MEGGFALVYAWVSGYMGTDLDGRIFEYARIMALAFGVSVRTNYARQLAVDGPAWSL